MSADPFPATSWTLIDQAKNQTDERGSTAAMGAFHQLYYRPVLQLVRSRLRNSSIEPEDVAQDFFLQKIWDGKLLAAARRDRTRFRHFLVRCVTNYVYQVLRRDARNPVQFVASPNEAVDVLKTEVAFDLEWARGLLQKAINSAIHKFAGKEKELHIQAFHYRYLTREPVPPGWDEVARQMGIDGSARKARTLGETFLNNVSGEIMHLLEIETGSRQAAEKEFAMLREILLADD